MSDDVRRPRVSRLPHLIPLRLFLPVLLVLGLVPRTLQASTINTTANLDSQLAAGGSLIQGGTFVADASTLAEFTLIVFAQEGSLGRAVVLATNGGMPVGTPLWQGPDIRWPLGLPLRPDGAVDLTYQPNVPLVPGETYFLGIDYGLFGAGFQNQIFFIGSTLNADPIPGGRAWAFIEGGGWTTIGTAQTDLAARIVMGTAAPTPRELVAALLTTVTQLGLPNGMSNALEAKLTAALGYIVLGNTTGATDVLNAFINSVEAQREKRLTTSQADLLVSAAREIISALGG